jgi:hypothetical protein
MRKLAYILIALLSVSCVSSYVHPCEDDLRRLDEALEEMDEYVAIKENRIATISESLSDPGLTLNQKYGVYGRLYEEYRPY